MCLNLEKQSHQSAIKYKGKNVYLQILTHRLPEWEKVSLRQSGFRSPVLTECLFITILKKKT